MLLKLYLNPNTNISIQKVFKISNTFEKKYLRTNTNTSVNI